jgi:flagellar assembly factor FliW
MEINTRDFGRININEDGIIYFPQGIPGFIDKKRYVLIELARDSIFTILQSIEDEGLAFICIPPWNIVEDYEIDINKNTEKMLEIEGQEDVMLLVICTIKDKIENMTVNLAAPVLFNHRKKLAKQLILDDIKYLTREPVFPEHIKQGAR